VGVSPRARIPAYVGTSKLALSGAHASGHCLIGGGGIERGEATETSVRGAATAPLRRGGMFRTPPAPTKFHNHTMSSSSSSSAAAGVHDTTVMKVEAATAPHGPRGERYLACGKSIAMREWEELPVGSRDKMHARYVQRLSRGWGWGWGSRWGPS